MKTALQNSWWGFLVLAISVATPSTHLNAQQAGGRILRREVREKDSQPHPYILITPAAGAQTNHFPLFVFLHGQCVSPEQVLKSHAGLLMRQNFYILLPEAPDDCGDGGYSWYDKSDANTLEIGLQRDERLLKQMISDVTRGENVDPARVTLCGFSSGARVTIFVGFRNPRMFSEIAPIGSFYMSRFDSYINDLDGLRVSIFHGTLDNVNPYADMKNAYEHLRERGVRVTLTTYPLGHEYTDEILGKIFDDVK